MELELQVPLWRRGSRIFCAAYDNDQREGIHCSGIADVFLLAFQYELQTPVTERKYTALRRRICSLMAEHKDRFMMISTSSTKGLCIALTIRDGNAFGALPKHEDGNARITEINDKIASLMRGNDCWSGQESQLVDLFSIDNFVNSYITVYWYWPEEFRIVLFDAYVISICENEITFATDDFIIRCHKEHLIWTSVHKTKDCDKVSPSYAEEKPELIKIFDEASTKSVADNCMKTCFQTERFSKFFNHLCFKCEDMQKILQITSIRSTTSKSETPKYISIARVVTFSRGLPFFSLHWYNDMKDTTAMKEYLENQILDSPQIAVPGQGAHKANRCKAAYRYNQMMHMCTNFKDTLRDMSAFQMTTGSTNMFLCSTEALYVDGMLDDLEEITNSEQEGAHMMQIAMHIFANMSWAPFRKKPCECSDLDPLQPLLVTLRGAQFEAYWTKEDFPDVVQGSDDNNLFDDRPAFEDAFKIDESDGRWQQYVELLQQTDPVVDIGKKRKAESDGIHTEFSKHGEEVPKVKDWQKLYNDMQRQKKEADAKIRDLQQDLEKQSGKIAELEKQNNTIVSIYAKQARAHSEFIDTLLESRTNN